MYNVDVEALRKAVESSENLTEVAYVLGFSKTNTRARTHLKSLIKENGFLFAARSEKYGNHFKPGPSLEEILVLSAKPLNTNLLKQKLLKAKLLPNKCMMPGCNVMGR